MRHNIVIFICQSTITIHFVSSMTIHSSGRVCERSGSSSIKEGPLDINTSGWSTPISLSFPSFLPHLLALSNRTYRKNYHQNSAHLLSHSKYQHLCLYYSVMHITSMSAFILLLVSTIYKEESERYGKISMVMEKMKTLNKSKSSGTMGVISV